VHSATWQDNTWQVSCNHPEAHDCITHLPINRIWLATGSTLDINHWPLLSAIREQYPISDVKGLPILDKHLRWPGCNLFIMGGAAALRVGPVARNLFGGKLACDRIVPALIQSAHIKFGN
ncbi:MAG: FAD-dependent oxidoreductase, partial [Cyanobacteria bacterium P01_F01_bin.3]